MNARQCKACGATGEHVDDRHVCPKIVYVLTQTPYHESGQVHGVFTTKEAAKAFLKIPNLVWGDDADGCLGKVTTDMYSDQFEITRFEVRE